MRASDVGELGIIEGLQRLLKAKPPGDDCAVIPLDSDTILVLTCDMLHRTTDFPVQMTPWQMGWMCAAASWSDVAAMGAKPLGLIAAVGIPPDEDVDVVFEFTRGMQDCSLSIGSKLMGGDTDEHAEFTVVTCAAGMSTDDNLLMRSGAHPGDGVAVTGNLGGPAAAYRLLYRDYAADDETRSELLSKFFEPQPRVDWGRALGGCGAVTSCCDLSDGLGKGLFELSRAGGVGFDIDWNELPLHPGARSTARDLDDMYDIAVCFGGEFELLFTFDPTKRDRLPGDVEFTVIGEVSGEASGLALKNHPGVDQIKCRGYEHLLKRR
jgi:thiamine-monophosphate kinase